MAMGKRANPVKFPLFFIVLLFFYSTTPKNHPLSTPEIFKDLSCTTISLVNKNPIPFSEMGYKSISLPYIHPMA
jgi:hypothetical protein